MKLKSRAKKRLEEQRGDHLSEDEHIDLSRDAAELAVRQALEWDPDEKVELTKRRKDDASGWPVFTLKSDGLEFVIRRLPAPIPTHSQVVYRVYLVTDDEDAPQHAIGSLADLGQLLEN